MSEEREQSCEVRIAAQMEGRADDFRQLFAIANEEKSECPECEGTGECQSCGGLGETVDASQDHVDCLACDLSGQCSACEGSVELSSRCAGEAIDQDEAYNYLSEYPLAVSVRFTARIDLSTGGPGDWLEADLEKTRHGFEVQDVTYHFNDWFDHAERRVDTDSPLWRAAEYYAELLGGSE